MERRIRIIAGDVELDAVLSDTGCAGDIYDALPIETAFNTWGDEFYFAVPVSRELDETATTQVKVGDIRILAARRGPGHILRPHARKHRRRPRAGERGKYGR